MAPLAIVQKLINEANELIEDPTEKLSASSILAAQDQEEGDKRSDHRESIQEENSSVATISSEIEIKNPLTIQDHEIKLETADVEQRFDIVEAGEEKVIVEKTYYFPDNTIDIGSETDQSDVTAISEEPLICHSESFESDNQLDSKGIDVIQDTSKSIHQAASIAKSKDLNASNLLIDNRISTTEEKEETTHKDKKVIEIVDEEYPFDKSSQAETNRSLHDLQDSTEYASNIVPDSNKEVLPIDETDKSSSALELYAEKIQTDVVTESTLFSKNVLQQTLKQIYSERQEPNSQPTSKLDTSYPIKEGIATTAAAIDNTKEEIKRILHPDDPVTRDSSSLSKKEHPRTTISEEKGLAVSNQETIISDEPFLDHRSISEEDSDSSSLEQIKPSDNVASFKVEHSSSSEKQELSYQCQGDKRAARVLSEEQPKLNPKNLEELQDNNTTETFSSEIYITETLLDQTCSVKIDKDSIIPVLSTESSSSSATIEDSTTAIATTKTLSDKNNIDIEPTSSSSPPQSILDPPLESSTQPLITENLDQIHHHSSSAECSEQIQIAAEESSSSSEPIPASGESITPKSDQIEPEPETREIYIPNSAEPASTINQPQVESDRSEHSKNIQNQEHVVLNVSESQSQKSIISEQILSPNESSSSSVIPTDIPSSDQIELSESIETYQATVKSSEEIVANKNQWQIPQHQTIKQSSDSKEIEELPTQILEKDTFEQPSGHTETETNKTSWGKKILKGSALAVGAIAGAAVVIPALGAAAAASAASSAAATAAASLASASAAGAGVSATTGVAAAASATAAGAAYVATTQQQPSEEEATTEDLDSANSNYS